MLASRLRARDVSTESFLGHALRTIPVGKEGSDGGRTGQRKKVNYNAAATETSTSQHKVEGAPELGWLFRAAPN